MLEEQKGALFLPFLISKLGGRLYWPGPSPSSSVSGVADLNRAQQLPKLWGTARGGEGVKEDFTAYWPGPGTPSSELSSGSRSVPRLQELMKTALGFCWYLGVVLEVV